MNGAGEATPEPRGAAARSLQRLEIRGREFAWGTRTYVMGVINLSPDSFSGDGIGADPARAAALACRMAAEGADIIDVGAESSRPGAEPVSAEEECRRLLVCLPAIRAATWLPLSIDTWRGTTAAAALAAGADMINDIHGLRADASLAEVVASSGAPVVLMHNQRGRERATVVSGVRRGFETSLAITRAAGIPDSRVILDPGFGFGWSPDENLEMVRRLAELRVDGLPLLVGVSRKSSIGAVTGEEGGPRLEGTAAAVALAVSAGVDVVRVHDVAAMRRAVLVADAITRAGTKNG
jgi:dihydropteroate synthase